MPNPDFVAVVKYSGRVWRKIRKQPLRKDIEAAWLSGYSFGIKETKDLFTKTPCTLRKRRV